MVLSAPWSTDPHSEIRRPARPRGPRNEFAGHMRAAARTHLRAAARCAIRGPGGPFRARIGASPGHPSAGCAEGAGHGIASSQQPAPGHAMAGLWPASAHRLVQKRSRRFPAGDGLGPQRARQGGEAGQVVDPVPVHAAAHRRAGRARLPAFSTTPLIASTPDCPPDTPSVCLPPPPPVLSNFPESPPAGPHPLVSI